MKNKSTKVAATAIIAALFLTVPAVAANAYSSTSTNKSPSGCSGGFAGSSYQSGSSSIANTGRNGSTCSGAYPTITAYVRRSDGALFNPASSAGTFTSTSYGAVGPYGGYHKWGGVAITSP